jgi:hypothetical protein
MAQLILDTIVNKFTIVVSRIPDMIVAFGQTRHNIKMDLIEAGWTGLVWLKTCTSGKLL